MLNDPTGTSGTRRNKFDASVNDGMTPKQHRKQKRATRQKPNPGRGKFADWDTALIAKYDKLRDRRDDLVGRGSQVPDHLQSQIDRMSGKVTDRQANKYDRYEKISDRYNQRMDAGKDIGAGLQGRYDRLSGIFGQPQVLPPDPLPADPTEPLPDGLPVEPPELSGLPGGPADPQPFPGEPGPGARDTNWMPPWRGMPDGGPDTNWMPPWRGGPNPDGPAPLTPRDRRRLRRGRFDIPPFGMGYPGIDTWDV